MKLRSWIVSLAVLFVFCISIAWKEISVFGNQKSAEIEIEEVEKITKKSAVLTAEQRFEKEVDRVYLALGAEKEGLRREVFQSAYTGYLNLQQEGKLSETKPIISIIDFSLSSKVKRLWIMDLEENKVLLTSLVSHGRGSGGEMATQFSNLVNSHQSSLGFYLTGEVYYGKHGRSLRLDGLDKDFNDRARERAIVIHGASYVSEQAIQNLNRLGLSHGCPAVPLALTNQVIDWVHDKTMLYIHGGVQEYSSPYLDRQKASQFVATNQIALSSSTEG